jgi:hypothetical protein
MAMYKTWPGFTLLTYSEILPVGVLMALISAIVYSRKKKKPVAVSAA